MRNRSGAGQAEATGARRRLASPAPRLEHMISGGATGCRPTLMERKTATRDLFVGFSDDRGLVVPVVVLFVFFVLVIIVVGVTRRHRVAHDAD